MKPLHITQLIPYHKMFADKNSGADLIGNIADVLTGERPLIGVHRREKISKYNLHHIAVASHKTGEHCSDVLETFTVWREDYLEDGEDMRESVRMVHGLVTEIENLGNGSFEVTDEITPGSIAANLYYQIVCEMEVRRNNPTREYSIHRVFNIAPTEEYTWSGYSI